MKDKNVKLALLIGGIVIVVFVIYRIYKTRQVNIMTPVSGNTNETHAGNFTDVTNPAMILKKGMSGTNVIALQNAVNQKITTRNSGITKVVPDGAFGSATETAIQQLSAGFLSSIKNNISVNAINALPNTNTY